MIECFIEFSFIPLFQEKALPLREIMSRLERVYCGSIGAEFMHIPDIDQVRTLQMIDNSSSNSYLKI